MSTVAQLQEKLDNNGIELLIVSEGLSDKQIAAGKYRVASYGEDSEYGSTYFIGVVSEISEYVNTIVKRKQVGCC